MSGGLSEELKIFGLRFEFFEYLQIRILTKAGFVNSRAVDIATPNNYLCAICFAWTQATNVVQKFPPKEVKCTSTWECTNVGLGSRV